MITAAVTNRWDLFIIGYYGAIEYIVVVVAVVILLSSLDDLFIDSWYWTREILRALTVKRTYQPLTIAQIGEKEEQYLAIMVPAWMEDDVIAAMIEDAVRVLDYRRYMIFVGTYHNDAATIAEVERMQKRYKQLRRVELPHDGPTCKADCLNEVVRAIFQYEQEHNIEFAGVVMHDSEDVLHPSELKFFNYLLPRKDMIQLPVASLERSWAELVAGTYMDEFAEWHAKDLVVRESLSGMVPSAGVGTCFSRLALLSLIEQNNNQPFNTDSLTEDYDVGTRLAKMEMRSIFARFPVHFTTRRRKWFGWGAEREIHITMPLCVRAFFPDTIRTAYRQRARWTLGIAMQSWEQNGWHGSLKARYLLLRDRKGVVTTFFGIIAYLLVIQLVVFGMIRTFGWLPHLLPPAFLDSPWEHRLLYANAIAIALRISQRYYFVARLYGWEHGVLSVPRMIVGNFINCLAVSRAWRLFIVHLVTGKKLAWDKTMHDFPSTEGQPNRRQRLGELLMSWQAIDETKLEIALSDARERQLPLGRVLMSYGWLDDETLAEAIAFQWGLQRGVLDEALLLRDHAQLPVQAIVRYRVLVQGEDAHGHAILLTASALNDDAFQDATSLAGRPLVQRIVRESEISTGLRLVHKGDGSGGALARELRGVPLIGDLLVEAGDVHREVFEAALHDYRPDRDGRIGDYMVARTVISPHALSTAVARQRQLRDQIALAS
jgi:bacteriophage N4 adsorption protein B